MPAELTAHARDGSAFSIVCTFTDEDGNSIDPSPLTWTLLSPALAVVNSRENVSAPSSEGKATITLGPDDVQHADGNYRYLVLTGKYNSSYGNGLTLREQVLFYIDDINEKAA